MTECDDDSEERTENQGSGVYQLLRGLNFANLFGTNNDSNTNTEKENQ